MKDFTVFMGIIARHKPATPLPWTEATEWDDDADSMDSEKDFQYILHAANAYPKLEGFVRCVAELDEYEIHTAELLHGATVRARELLKELGEL